jgi:hypothetical protein
MAPKDLYDIVRARPFRPFRIFLNDGGTYDVRHPEWCMVGIDSALVGLAENESDSPFYQRLAILDLFSISRVEPLPAPASASSKS